MSITTSIVFENEQERDYIKRLIKVRRNLIGLVENGALETVPDMIALTMAAIQGNKPQNVSPSGIVAETDGKLPQFVEDVLNGGAFPNREDCTHEEAAVLYDKRFQALFQAYMIAKKEEQRQNIRLSIGATINEILC